MRRRRPAGALPVRRRQRRPARRAASRPAPRCASTPATSCSTRASRPTSGGCSSRAGRPRAARRPRGDRRSGRWTRPGSGPAGSARGTRTAPTSRQVAPRRPAGSCASRRGSCARGRAGCPVRRAPDRGPVPDRAQDSSPRPGNARRSSRSARWRPASPTSSTTQPRPRHGRSTRSVTPATPCCPRSGASPSGRSRPSSSSPSTRCGSEIRPAPVRHDPLAVADREEALSSWLSDHGVERDWVIAPAAGRGRRRRRLVRAGGERARRQRTRARARVGREHAVGRDAAGGGEGVHAGGSRTWSGP